MFNKLFEGMGKDGCGCGLFGSQNSSCDVLVILVILFVLFNCGILDCGIDLCTIAILLLFFCCCKGNKGRCHSC